jgi:16S rRNA (cytosine967-C5)-methyltransferase
MSAAPARRAAYRILLNIARAKGDLPGGIAAERARLPDPRDQALAAAIAIGTERWRGCLDFLIERFARRKIDALDVEVLTSLRLSACQILYLSRIPPSAAVTEGVELVREARKKSAAGFANAVLRAIARERGAPPLPARPDPAPGAAADDGARGTTLLDYFSVTLSHPRWLAARWLARYGEAATEAWLRFNNQEAPLTLRANVLKISVEDLAARLEEHGVATTRTRYAPHGLVVTSGNPLTAPLEREDLFVLQDEASQLVATMVPTRPGDRVLDACASPGGKTTAIAAGMDDRGLIVASDVRPRRIALLRETLRRSGARCVRVTQADFTRPAPFEPVFDAVLLDAPCSGLGTLRRDPDVKWRRVEADLAVLAAAELTMLRHAADTVRPGGWLVYATCSSEPEENEEVVRQFLAERPDYVPAPAPPGVTRTPGDAPSPVDAAGHLRTYPHIHGLEAFFAALLQRRPAASP